MKKTIATFAAALLIAAPSFSQGSFGAHVEGLAAGRQINTSSKAQLKYFAITAQYNTNKHFSIGAGLHLDDFGKLKYGYHIEPQARCVIATNTSVFVGVQSGITGFNLPKNNDFHNSPFIAPRVGIEISITNYLSFTASLQYQWMRRNDHINNISHTVERAGIVVGFRF